MLMPKRTKYRKVRKGKIRGVATAGNYIAFGDYALQAQGHERITRCNRKGQPEVLRLLRPDHDRIRRSNASNWRGHER